MRSLLGRFHRPNARSQSEQLLMLNNLGDGSTLSLDFTAMGGTLDTRFTFTRSTTGTYINSSGVVTSASTNVARFDYDPTTLTARGLLIEGSATNQLQRSEEFQTSPWSAFSGSITANDGVAPDGNTTADSITPSVAGGGTFYSTSFAAGTWTFSIWAKANPGSSFNISVDNASNGRACTYTLTSGGSAGTPFVRGTGGTVTSFNASTQTFQNSWVRCVATVVTTGANFIAITNPTDTNKILVWGAQLEAGSGAPSSYIPTSASTVQRTADTCIASSTGFSSWFTGGTSGTFYADWYGGVRSITSTVRSVLSTSDVTARHLHLQQTAAAGNLKVADFGAANVVTTSNSITSGARTKGAFSFSGGTVNLTLNGGTVATSSSLAFSTAPTWLVVGGTSTDGSTITDGTVVLNGSIRAIKYWPSVLATATLQSLTT